MKIKPNTLIYNATGPAGSLSIRRQPRRGGGVALSPPRRQPARLPTWPQKCFKVADAFYSRYRSRHPWNCLMVGGNKLTGSYDLWMHHALPFLYAGFPAPELPPPGRGISFNGLCHGRHCIPPACKPGQPHVAAGGLIHFQYVEEFPSVQGYWIHAGIRDPFDPEPWPIKATIRACWSPSHSDWGLAETRDILTQSVTWWPSNAPRHTDPRYSGLYFQLEDNYDVSSYQVAPDVSVTFPPTVINTRPYTEHNDPKPQIYILPATLLGYAPAPWSANVSIASHPDNKRIFDVSESWKTYLRSPPKAPPAQFWLTRAESVTNESTAAERAERRTSQTYEVTAAIASSGKQTVSSVISQKAVMVLNPDWSRSSSYFRCFYFDSLCYGIYYEPRTPDEDTPADCVLASAGAWSRFRAGMPAPWHIEHPVNLDQLPTPPQV
jgi:hypothetical protein